MQINNYKELETFKNTHKKRFKPKIKIIEAKSIPKTSIPLQLDITNNIFVYDLGKRRREYNIQTLNHPHQNDWNPDADIIGVFGEFAFEQLTGLPMDKRIGPRDSYDFKVKDLFIDVKATEESSLMPTKIKRLEEVLKIPNYYYVFCRGSLATFFVEFIGCIKAVDVKGRGNLYVDDKVFKVHENYLDPMEIIYKELKNRKALNNIGFWQKIV
jgi:hypothetical protein